MRQRIQTLGTVLVVGPLLFLSMSCSPPLHIVWDDHQPVLRPQESQARLQPEGLLIVYSEHYDKPIAFDEGPTRVRRPIHLYNDEGQFLEEYNYNPVNDDPISITLPPGYYIVASEAKGELRRVQVAVQDGHTTVVPEALLAQASLASSLNGRVLHSGKG